MGTPTYPAGLRRVEGEQLSLSTALASLGIPNWAQQGRIYVPSTNFRMQFNPAILSVVFYDASASAGSRWKNGGSTHTLLEDMTDRSDVFGAATGSGTLLDGMTTSDFLYICTSDVVGGFRVAMTGSVNTDASVVAFTYRKNDDTWAALTETDGTIAPAGVTLGATGSITWTAPTDAKQSRLPDIFTDVDVPGPTGYWWRLAVGTALSADVEISGLWTLNKDTDRGYFYLGEVEHASFDKRYVGAVEMILASGTDTADLTWIGA